MHDSCKFYVHFFSIFVFFNHLTISVTGKLSTPYSPNDNILLNCGYSGISTDPDGREWTGDIGSQLMSLQQSINDPSFVSNSSFDHVPYTTARVSVSGFTYLFLVSPGQKFIRLYFYPSTYQGFDRSKGFFTVTAGPFTLLSNFSASLAADSLGSESVVKEFCVNVEKYQRLNITFTPFTNTSADAYAFINGIEIVSMPTNLYYSGSGDKSVPLVGHPSYRFLIKNDTALEMVHRLNMGGSFISPIKDSGKMFRTWSNDTEFFLNSGVSPISNREIQINYTRIHAYTAPEEVYQTARSTGKSKEGNMWHNLTWRLPVDLGFKYLVRLHFCEIQPADQVKKSDDRKFDVSIRNRTAEVSADLMAWGSGQGIPVFRDYVVMVRKEENTGKNHLFVVIRPNGNSNANAILNGLELFKLNNSDGNLAGPNPEFSVPQSPLAGPSPEFSVPQIPLKPSPPQANNSKGTKLAFKPIVGLGAITILSLIGLTIYRQWKREKPNKSKLSPVLGELCRRFTLNEIKTATNNFDRSLIIGRGGSCYVYKGYIDIEQTPVAIKIFKPTSTQGPREFLTEIEMLSKLRHTHLVSLIGYCKEERYMMIVYDYMPHGTLSDHLYDTENPPLSWKRRLEICIGAARGLCYLHRGAEQTIIHRDVKTSNILLDQNWVAKVSDFGLSRLGPTSLSKSHVTTNVKGTFGYIDPEYFNTTHLTVKSDVYGFGVVLFEVLCARPAVDSRQDEEQHSLAEWASNCVKNGTLDQIIDRRLIGQISPECLKVYARIADRCLCEDRDQRPTMADVLRALEFASEFQDIADAEEQGINLGGAHRVVIIDEEIPLCGSGDQVVSRPGNNGHLVHSCPTIWPKSLSKKELLRFLSDKAGLKWEKPTKPCCFAATEYNALPSVQVQLPDLNSCGPYTTPGKYSIEVTKTKGQ